MLPVGLGSRRAALLIERNIYVYRRGWMVIFSGFFEPLFYLLSIGLGIGGMIGDVPLPNGDHDPVRRSSWRRRCWPAPSMNGAIAESTFNVFFKLNYQKTYDAVLATPLGPGDVALGEIGWAVIRATLYALGFMVVHPGPGARGVAVGDLRGPRSDAAGVRVRRGRAWPRRRSCARGRTST